jgi:hypothetical protein
VEELTLDEEEVELETTELETLEELERLDELELMPVCEDAEELVVVDKVLDKEVVVEVDVLRAKYATTPPKTITKITTTIITRRIVAIAFLREGDNFHALT